MLSACSPARSATPGTAHCFTQRAAPPSPAIATGIGTGGLAGAEFDGADDTRWGGTVGVGIEYGFAPNWSVGLEYDHLFMGRRDVTLTANGVLAPVGTFSRTDRIGQDVDLITARINYRFGGPIIAKY